MSQQPSTPVKVLGSAATYTPATLDPDLRSQINTVLLRDGHVTKIQESLLHSLNAHQTNWPSNIQSHALSLLRSGEVTTFPALLRRVLEDVREASALDSSSNSNNNSNNNNTTTSSNNSNGTNGSKPSATNGTSSSSTPNGTVPAGTAGLAVPEAVIEEALKVTRESLSTVCEIEGNATS